VRFKNRKDKTMTPNEYQERALVTLATDNDRDTLSMCGLGLSGEVGEITDVLKKYLHHKNGKALDVSKICDEVGDVLWYLSILCSTLDISLEEAMERNIEKLEKRHGNGFRARYESDSHVSE
jgi:NTP pyrophosphatase (non-canonical NTP hydrolase)